MTIYHLVEANLTSSAAKYEEGHDIVITETISNPSNVTVTNVNYLLKLPADLTLLSGGQPNFTVDSLGPGQSTTNNFQVITNQPDVYNINQTSLTFQYQGTTLKGIAGSLSLNLGDDLTTRYAIPILIAIVIALASIFYVRRLTRKSTNKPATSGPSKAK